MKLWPWKPRGERPDHDPTSDKQRLEQLLYRLADVIGDHDESDRFWSGKVRACADEVRAGKPWGLRHFLSLFGGMGSINDQGFSHPLREDLSEAYTLASALLGEVVSEASGQRDEIVLRPWREGHTGKALVYGNGLVVASEDDAGGGPDIAQIRRAAAHEDAVVAIVGIKPDGSCDAYRCERDENWLADRLQDHNPALHLMRA